MNGRWGGRRVTDPPAARQFVGVGSLQPEYGGPALDVEVAYETWGRPRRVNGHVGNAVLVEHALTGDAHVAGPAGPGQPTAGWWSGLVGPGLALDTDVWFVVCANVLGGCQGTTGPSSAAPDGRPYGSRFPRLTIRDQVEVERRLADHLDVATFVAVLGGSMGGMRALEWAATYPGRVGAALLLATCAAASADQVALQTVQIQAITRDDHWRGGDYDLDDPPVVGLGLARRMAHLSYRSALELDVRFGRAAQSGEDPAAAAPDGPGGRFQVTSYLDHHADKLVRRFDAGSYVRLTDAMNTHDVGRGRSGTTTALAAVGVPVVVGGIDSDRLYALAQQQELAQHIPTADPLEVVSSVYGHDGFLLEIDSVAKLVHRTLERGR